MISPDWPYAIDHNRAQKVIKCAGKKARPHLLKRWGWVCNARLSGKRAGDCSRNYSQQISESISTICPSQTQTHESKLAPSKLTHWEAQNHIQPEDIWHRDWYWCSRWIKPSQDSPHPHKNETWYRKWSRYSSQELPRLCRFRIAISVLLGCHAIRSWKHWYRWYWSGVIEAETFNSTDITN